MKKLLLLLLGCGMYVGAISQIEVPKKNTGNSNKWVITPLGLNEKKNPRMGRLNTNFGPDVYWHIHIYDETYLNSSDSMKSHNLAPGEYYMTFNYHFLGKVPIQTNCETRIKHGFLNIKATGLWMIRCPVENGTVNSGTGPKKLVLPVGSCGFKLAGQNSWQMFLIKDMETVEF